MAKTNKNKKWKKKPKYSSNLHSDEAHGEKSGTPFSALQA